MKTKFTHFSILQHWIELFTSSVCVVRSTLFINTMLLLLPDNQSDVVPVKELCLSFFCVSAGNS